MSEQFPVSGDEGLKQRLDLTEALLRQCRADRDVIGQELLDLHQRLFVAERRVEQVAAALARVTSSRSYRAMSPVRNWGGRLAQRRSVADSEEPQRDRGSAVVGESAPVAAPVDVPIEVPERDGGSVVVAESVPVEVPVEGVSDGGQILLEAGQIALDVSALTDPARAGIARVLIRLGRELEERYPGRSRPVLVEDGVLKSADSFSTEVTGLTPSPGPPARIVGAPGAVLLSVSIPTPDEMDDWFAAVDDFRSAGGRYVQVVHDLLPITMPDFFAIGMRMSFPVWLERVGERAEGILTDSQATLADLQATADDRSWALPSLAESINLGCDGPANSSAVTFSDGSDSRTARAVASIGQDEFVVLTVGTIEPRKGHDALMEAAERVWVEAPQVRFVVVGRKGWASPSILARMAELSNSPRPFTWIDGSSDAELREWYRRADLLVAPSRGEGYGLPIAEAMAAGVPVVARDIPVFRELVGEDGAYFGIDDELAPAILRQIADPIPAPGADRLSSWSDLAGQIVSLLAPFTRTG